MQPKTHAFVINAAVAASERPWLHEHLGEILRGCEDEDVWLVGPLRLRAPGLTHSYKPGSSRGELGARSARTCLLRCVERARRSEHERDAARWLGRACHLLGDMAVPARALGVWHLLGDPLETFWETHHQELALGDAALLDSFARSAADLAESLARAASRERVDTTRTPWGFFAERWLKRGEKLDEATVSAQARALLPLAVAHTRALLESEAERRVCSLNERRRADR